MRADWGIVLSICGSGGPPPRAELSGAGSPTDASSFAQERFHRKKLLVSLPLAHRDGNARLAARRDGARRIAGGSLLTWHDTRPRNNPEEIGTGCRSGHSLFDASARGRGGRPPHHGGDTDALPDDDDGHRRPGR